MHCGDTSQTIFGGRIGKRERNCSSSFQVRPQMLRDSGIDVTEGTEEFLGVRQCHAQRTVRLGWQPSDTALDSRRCKRYPVSANCLTPAPACGIVRGPSDVDIRP